MEEERVCVRLRGLGRGGQGLASSKARVGFWAQRQRRARRRGRHRGGARWCAPARVRAGRPRVGEHGQHNS